MSNYENQTRSTHPVLHGLGTFFKILLRLIAVLVIGALIGAGLYYGIPRAYSTLVDPIQENRARIVALEHNTDQSQERIQAEAKVLQERLATLETKIGTLEETVAVQTASLDSNAEQLQQQSEELAAIPSSFDNLEQGIATLEEELTAQMETMDELREDFAAAEEELAAGTKKSQEYTEVLAGRLALMQTAQDLLKVKLLLLEENPRAARDTVALAVTHLEISRTMLPQQDEALTKLQTRLEELEELIAADSFRVEPAIEALWADVMELVLPPIKPSTPPPEASPLPTPTPTTP